MASSYLESLKIDPELLFDVASRVSRLKMYPYFDAAHYTMMCLSVREDLATGATLFSRKHPLSCWLSSMMMCFAGSFLACFLLGEPVVTPFKRHDDLLLASVVWYLVFYSPFDVVYKLAKVLPFKAAIGVMKETQRAYKVQNGVQHAFNIYPNALVVVVIVGTVKGAGSGIMRTFEQLVRGVWFPTGNEVLRPSFATKACLLASLLLVAEKKTDWLDGWPHELVYFTIVIFFVYFKLSAIVLSIHDPFAPFENLFCAVCMGGIWDAVGRAVAASRDRRTAGGVASGGTPSSEQPAGQEGKKEQ